MSLTHDEKCNLFGNTIIFPQNFAIRGAVRKYAMGFCLKKNFPSYVCATSQCALVLTSFFSGKFRVIYTVSPFCLHVSKKKIY